LDTADVLDGDAVRSRALNLVERQLVVAFGLEVADVARANVVDRELIPPPQIKIVVEAERLHFRGVRRARRKREQAGALAVAERSLEGDGPRFPAHLELHACRGQMLVVGREAREVLDRVGLAHVPAGAKVAGPGAVRWLAADLQEDLALAKLGRPGSVNVRLRKNGDGERP